MDQIKTGRLIRALRQGQNLTQAELGEKLGVGGKAVSKWECGAGAPDIALLPLSLTVHHALVGHDDPGVPFPFVGGGVPDAPPVAG